MRTDKDNYDAVIIGAGIGGLVCGCYLAKAGLKVLIAEQHFKPGGYCSSFTRGGFTFDAAAHSFGAYRENGIVRRVFNDLDVAERLTVVRADPSDVVITRDCKVSFWSDHEKTVRDFQYAFPAEHNNIANFFCFMRNPELSFFARSRQRTFMDLLASFFKDERLKAIIALPVYGNSGTSPLAMSAVMGSQVFTEFLLDGGYYPGYHVQSLPDTLSQVFLELEGTLLLSSPVKKIRIDDGHVKGIVLNSGDVITSRYVISNCDAKKTFFEMIGTQLLPEDFSRTLESMTPSLSAFILYLGIDHSFDGLLEPGTNFWFLSHYNFDHLHAISELGILKNTVGYLMHVSYDRKTLTAFINVPYMNVRFWDKYKKIMTSAFIEKMEADAIPDLSNHVVYADAATPVTLRRYTMNHDGATFGWAITPSQVGLPYMRKPSFLRGLYLTGHWVTRGLGISGVTHVAYDTARMILRKEKRFNNIQEH